MSELTGDPLVDFLEELLDYIAEHRGLRIRMPQKFSLWPEDCQREFLNDFMMIAKFDLTPTSGMSLEALNANPWPKGPGVIRFIFSNGPRPPITG